MRTRSPTRKTLNDIADWCDRFTPLVALDPPHGLFLDITGCAHLFGGEAALMQIVCDALTRQGFAVSAAIAGTSVCAADADAPCRGRIVADGEEAAAVRPLPVSALGVDEAITRGLRRAGLKTIGDVACRAPPRNHRAVRRRLHHAAGAGAGAGRCADLSAQAAAGLHRGEAVSPSRSRPTAVIAIDLSALAAMLVAAMERHGKGARRLEASFFRTDGAVRTIAVETGQP